MKAIALILFALSLVGCAHAVTPVPGAPTSYLNTPPPPPVSYLR